MTWPTIQVRFTPKMKLSCHGRLDQVRSVTKTILDNDVIDYIGAIHTKNEGELSGLIELGAIFNEKQTEQLRDRLYRSGLCWKQNWTVVIDRTECWPWRKLYRTTMWLIIRMWSTMKLKLSYPNQSDLVQFVMKSRHDNNVIDHTSLVYARNEIELSWSIEPSAVCDKIQIE